MPKPSPVFLKDRSVVYRVQYRLKPGGAPTADRFETYQQALDFCALIDRVGPVEARQIREAISVAGDSRVMTCRKAFEEFCEHLASYAEEGTIIKYRRMWDRYVADAFDAWPVGQVSRRQVEAWVAGLRKTETVRSRRAREAEPGLEPDFLSPKTIANAQGLISSVFKLQVDQGAISKNPARAVRLPQAHRKREAVFLTTAQRVELLAKVDLKWQTLVALLLATGLRWGEATALRGADFDFEAVPATVRVERAWKRGDGAYHMGPPKTKKSRRTVSLPVQLIDDLRDLAQAAGDDLVFQGPNGGRLRAEWFTQRVFAPAIDSAGISPRPRIHDLRHTHASMLLGAGVPIHIVQYRMGHESITTTVNVYGHLVPDAGRIAAEATELAMATAIPQVIIAAS